MNISKKIHWKISFKKHFFHYWHFLKTSILEALCLLKSRILEITQKFLTSQNFEKKRNFRKIPINRRNDTNSTQMKKSGRHDISFETWKIQYKAIYSGRKRAWLIPGLKHKQQNMKIEWAINCYILVSLIKLSPPHLIIGNLECSVDLLSHPWTTFAVSSPLCGERWGVPHNGNKPDFSPFYSWLICGH